MEHKNVLLHDELMTNNSTESGILGSKSYANASDNNINVQVKNTLNVLVNNQKSTRIANKMALSSAYWPLYS